MTHEKNTLGEILCEYIQQEKGITNPSEQDCEELYTQLAEGMLQNWHRVKTIIEKESGAEVKV